MPHPVWGTCYSVSSLGRVKNKRSGYILNPKEGKLGYVTVTLKKKPLKWCVAVHVLVLRAFLGPPPSELHECCHNDGNPQNNVIENLRWGTRSENFIDKILHGKSGRKFTESQVRDIKRRIVAGVKSWTIAKAYGVSAQTIENIKIGKSYFV